tara:strand:- start:7 stop:453 length:447 start_codon:yes stop_codon:yes gene_type:complete
MTLKELQNMIKEEFTAFQNEAEDDVDVSVSDADVDVDMGDDMGAEEAPAGEEDVLRAIYDLLTVHFGEGGEELPAEDMGDEEMPMDDAEGEVAPDSELDEWTGKNDPKPGGKGTTGYDNKPGGKGSTGYDAGSKALQERFQKLANIIK